MTQQQSGFSLVEMLVAIAISMVAMVAATSVYVSSKGTARLQEMQQRLSEDGRFGNSMLQRIISQAGYRETPASNLDDTRISVNAANDITVKFRTDGANQIVCDGSTPAAADQDITIQRIGTRLVCGAVAGVGGVDWIAPAAAGTGNGTEVMDFSVRMGVDTGPSTPENFGCGAASGGFKPRDCIVDSYVSTLAGPPLLTADQIVALKICWVLRSEATDASIVKAAAVLDCSGNAIANSQNDRRLYRAFNTTVLLRNR